MKQTIAIWTERGCVQSTSRSAYEIAAAESSTTAALRLFPSVLSVISCSIP
jgi:hypothetical protein